MKCFSRFDTLLITLLTAAAGCSSTQLSTSWKDPSAGPVAFEKVVVLVLNSTPAERRAQEDELVRQIKKTLAVPSYTIVTDDELANRERVKEKIRETGADGAVVLRMLESREQTSYIPGSTSYWDQSIGYAPYGRSSGFYVTDTIVRAEVSLYSVPDGKLLWAGSTATLNPTDARDLVAQVSRAAAAEMRAQGLLQ